MFEADRSHARAIAAATRLVEAHRISAGVPGMQVAVRVGDRWLWSVGLGYADLETARSVQRDTRFRIGSASKALTATLTAVLAEESRVELDAPVQRYVPAFPRRASPITLTMLVGHTAGIRHYRDVADFRRTDRFTTMTEAIRLFAADDLVAAPGEAMHYSSYGYNLLGAVIEGATGIDFLGALRARITGPLGMMSTDGVGVDPASEAVAYVGRRDDRAPAPQQDFSYKWPSGGLVSTAEDLARFGTGLLGGELVSGAMLGRLFESLRTNDGEAIGYGFGWALHVDDEGRRVAGHGGNLPSGRAHLLLYPELDLAVAILANTGESIYFNEGEALEVGGLFARSLDGAGGTVADIPTDAYGTWAFEAESFIAGEVGPVRGELELQRPQGPFHGELRFGVSGAQTVLQLGLAEAVNGRVRLIAVGGSHLRFDIQFDGDSFVGTVRPAWTPPPAGMLRAAPAEVRERIESRGSPRAVRGARTMGRTPYSP